MTKEREPMPATWRGSIWITGIICLLLAVLIICIHLNDLQQSQLRSDEEIVCMQLERTDCR